MQITLYSINLWLVKCFRQIYRRWLKRETEKPLPRLFVLRHPDRPARVAYRRHAPDTANVFRPDQQPLAVVLPAALAIAMRAPLSSGSRPPKSFHILRKTPFPPSKPYGTRDR